MKKEVIFNVNEDYIAGVIEYKFIKHIICKYSFGELKISAPYGTLKVTIEKFLSRIKINKKINFNKPLDDDYVYIYGKKYPILNGILETPYFKAKINKDNFYKVIQKYFKLYCQSRIDYFRPIMNISSIYKASVKLTKTRYGSNSLKTKKINLNTYLIHFNHDIIDSVIIHELAHDFERNHSSNFYNIIYKYCKDYDQLDRKLKENRFDEGGK